MLNNLSFRQIPRLILSTIVLIIVECCAIKASAQSQTTTPFNQVAPEIWAVHLDAHSPQNYWNGVRLKLLDSSRQLKVNVRCIRDQDVPKLHLTAAKSINAIEPRLENITGDNENHGCSAFDIEIDERGSLTSESGLLIAELPIIETKKKLVDGYVRTKPSAFVFNPVAGNWSKARGGGKPSSPNKVIATLTKKSNKIIAGVLAFPDILSQDPNALTPKALLSATEKLDPLSGVLRIKPPQANSMGGTSTELPLMLRPSRGPVPEARISYSATSGVGWLGKGWDLSVPTIEVVTVAPEFALEVESEDYAYQGTALIPVQTTDASSKPKCAGYKSNRPYATLARGGNIVRRFNKESETKQLQVCVTEYRSRDNAAGLKFWRIGSGPHDYYWKVYDPNSGVTRLFGSTKAATARQIRQHVPKTLTFDKSATDRGRVVECESISANSGLNACKPDEEEKKEEGIVRWYLTQTIDQQQAANTVSYFYNSAKECREELPKLRCEQKSRLMRVKYSEALEKTDLSNQACASLITGETEVVFDWNNKRELPWVRTNARSGKLLSQEHWLNSITVRYMDYEPESVLQPKPNKDFAKLKCTRKRLSNYTYRSRTYAHYQFKYGQPAAKLNFQQHLKSVELSAVFPLHGQNSDTLALSTVWPEQHSQMDIQRFEFDYYKAAADDSIWEVNQSIELNKNVRHTLDDARSEIPTLKAILPGDFNQLASASPLGTSGSEEIGGSLYLGFGVGTDVYSKNNTFGAKFGNTYSRSTGATALNDLSGDGIVDQFVELTDGGFAICLGKPKNPERKLASNGRFDQLRNSNWDLANTRTFSISPVCLKVEGLGSSFSLSDSRNQSAGLEVYPSGFFIGLGKSNSTNATQAFFSDIDSDGLSDIAANGVIYYNHGLMPCSADDQKSCLHFRLWSPLLPSLPNTANAAEAQVDEAFEFITNELTQIEKRLANQLNSLTQTKEYDQVVIWKAEQRGFITSNLFQENASIDILFRLKHDLVAKNLKQLILERAGVLPFISYNNLSSLFRSCEVLRTLVDGHEALVGEEHRQNLHALTQQCPQAELSEQHSDKIVSGNPYQLRNRLRIANLRQPVELEEPNNASHQETADSCKKDDDRCLPSDVKFLDPNQPLPVFEPDSQRKGPLSSIMDVLKSAVEPDEQDEALEAFKSGVNKNGISTKSYRLACKVHVLNYSISKDLNLSPRSINYLCGDDYILPRLEVFLDKATSNGTRPTLLFTRKVAPNGSLGKIEWADIDSPHRFSNCANLKAGIPEVTTDSTFHPFQETPLIGPKEIDGLPECDGSVVEVAEGDTIQVVINDSPQFQPLTSSLVGIDYVLKSGNYRQNREQLEDQFQGTELPEYLVLDTVDNPLMFGGRLPQSSPGYEVVSFRQPFQRNGDPIIRSHIAVVGEIAANSTNNNYKLELYSASDEDLEMLQSGEIKIENRRSEFLIASIPFLPGELSQSGYRWDNKGCHSIKAANNNHNSASNSKSKFVCAVIDIDSMTTPTDGVVLNTSASPNNFANRTRNIFALLLESKDEDGLENKDSEEKSEVVNQEMLITWTSPPRIEYLLRPDVLEVDESQPSTFALLGKAEEAVQIVYLPISDHARNLLSVRPRHNTLEDWGSDETFPDDRFTRQFSRFEEQINTMVVLCANTTTYLNEFRDRSETDVSHTIEPDQLKAYCSGLVERENRLLNEAIDGNLDFSECASLIDPAEPFLGFDHNFAPEIYCTKPEDIQNLEYEKLSSRLNQLAGLLGLPTDPDILREFLEKLENEPGKTFEGRDHLSLSSNTLTNGAFKLPPSVKPGSCQTGSATDFETCLYSARLDLRETLNDRKNSLFKLTRRSLKIPERDKGKDWFLRDFQLKLLIKNSRGIELPNLKNTDQTQPGLIITANALKEDFKDIPLYEFKAHPGEELTFDISVSRWTTAQTADETDRSKLIPFDHQHLETALRDGLVFDLAELYLKNKSVPFLFINRVRNGTELAADPDKSDKHEIPIQLPVSYNRGPLNIDFNDQGWSTYVLVDNGEEGTLPAEPNTPWSLTKLQNLAPRPNLGDAFCGLGADNNIQRFGNFGSELGTDINSDLKGTGSLDEGKFSQNSLNDLTQGLAKGIQNAGCDPKGVPPVAFYRHRWIGPAAYNPLIKLNRDAKPEPDDYLGIIWEQDTKLLETQLPVEGEPVAYTEVLLDLRQPDPEKQTQNIREHANKLRKPPEGLCFAHEGVNAAELEKNSDLLRARWFSCHMALDADIALREISNWPLSEKGSSDGSSGYQCTRSNSGKYEDRAGESNVCVVSETDRLGAEEAAVATLRQQAETLETLTIIADTLLDRNLNTASTNCTEGFEYKWQALSGRPRPCILRAATDDIGLAPRLFSPIQRSETSSIALNISGGPASASVTSTKRDTTLNFLDINGDGFKEIISKSGTSSPTSPVGITRAAWFKAHNHERNVSEISGFLKNADAISFTLGASASAPTAGKFLSRGVRTLTSGAIEGNFSPSISGNIGYGFDTNFQDFADFNGDGLVDVYQGSNLGSRVNAQFNLGNGLSTTLVFSPALGQRLSGTTNKGRSDNFSAANHETHFGVNNTGGLTLNLGASFNNNSLSFGLGTGMRISSQEVAFLDFTGDGLSDLVIPVTWNIKDCDGNRGFVFLPNLGNGFDWKHWRYHCIEGLLYSENGASEATFVDKGGNYTSGITAFGLKFVFTVGLKQTENHNRTLVQIQDFNADGVPDIAQVKGAYQGTHDKSGALWIPQIGTPDGNSTPQIFYNPEARVGLLRTITNPTQVKTELAYELKGNSSARHGQKIWALAGTRTYDGYEPNYQTAGYQIPPANNNDVRLPRDGHDINLTLYDYERGHYQRAEKAFYGFKRLTTHQIGCDLSLVMGADTNCNSDALFERLRRSQVTHANENYFLKGSAVQFGLIDPQTERVLSIARIGFSIQDHRTNDQRADVKTVFNNRLPVEVWHSAIYDELEKIPAAPQNNKVMALDHTLEDCSKMLALGSFTKHCSNILENANSGASQREYAHPFAQYPAAKRSRLELSAVFGNGSEFTNSWDGKTGSDDQEKRVTNDEDIPTELGLILPISTSEQPIYSALLTDTDIWGQARRFQDLGILSPDLAGKHPAAEIAAQKAKTISKIDYTDIEIASAIVEPNDILSSSPLLNRPASINIFDEKTHLRSRQGLYEPSTGNVTDMCVFDPDNEDGTQLKIKPETCATFVQGVSKAMSIKDGGSGLTAKAAVSKVLGELDYPVPVSNLIHQQISSYDPYGNPLNTVSPLNQDGEWVERHFDYQRDPFRNSPTTVSLSRCLLKTKLGWKGLSSTNERFGCSYLSSDQRTSVAGANAVELGSPGTQVTHLEVVHQSKTVIDRHHGAPAVTLDINGHALLIERDKWQRPILVARNFGGETPADYNKDVKEVMDRAANRFAVYASGRWHPVLDIRYGAVGTNGNVPADSDAANDNDCGHPFGTGSRANCKNFVFAANVRRFVSSQAYRGLQDHQLPDGAIQSFVLADGQGKKIQEIRHSEICIKARELDAGVDESLCAPEDFRSLVVQPMPSTDILGRQMETFEAYEGVQIDGSDVTIAAVKSPLPIFASNATTKLIPLNTSLYDAADKPLVQLSRVSWMVNRGEKTDNQRILRQQLIDDTLTFVETSQMNYSSGGFFKVGDLSYPKFNILNLSPRCSAVRSVFDARGLTLSVSENQTNFFNSGRATLPTSLQPGMGKRPYDLDLCKSVSDVATQWNVGNDERADQSIVYRYDALRYLKEVELPFVKVKDKKESESLGTIKVDYDGFGRRIGIDDVNMGHRQFSYDQMSNVVGETAKPLGSSTVETSKSYLYDANRLIGIDYSSGAKTAYDIGADKADSVRFFYDGHPEIAGLIADEAAGASLQKRLDQIGCENCFGKVALVRDRTGLRASTFNPLGQDKLTLRSMLDAESGLIDKPVQEVGRFEIASEFTSFGDLIAININDQEPANPHPNCLRSQPSGVKYLCGGKHRIAYRYTPDGKNAAVSFGQDEAIITQTAFDSLARPFAKKTGDGSRALYSFDLIDLRLNTARAQAANGWTIHNNDYRYEVGGNIRDYRNRVPEGVSKSSGDPMPQYQSQFSFGYDPANRLRTMVSEISRGSSPTQKFTAAYAYDVAHRFSHRYLSNGTTAHLWHYDYEMNKTKPVHAPSRIGYTNGKPLSFDNSLSLDFGGTSPLARFNVATNRNFGSSPGNGVDLDFDGLGRLQDIARGDFNNHKSNFFDFSSVKVPTNRRISWDAEDRIRRIIAPQGSPHIDDHYSYDFGNNRAVKQVTNDQGERSTTLYVTPFYAREISKRGTIQISANNLPVASIAIAAGDTNDASLATYLFADLATGSVTASVTTPGLSGFSDPLIARQEYSPYGIALAANRSKEKSSEGLIPNGYSFHGKELDTSTGFSSFGARSYSAEMAVWLSADPILNRYLFHGMSNGLENPINFSPFSAFGNNPVISRDANGQYLCQDESCNLSLIDAFPTKERYPNQASIEAIYTGMSQLENLPGYSGKPAITFQNDNSKKPHNHVFVKTKLANMVEQAMLDSGVKSININSSIRSGSTKSNHGRKEAVDINRINGLRVDDPNASELVKKLQAAFQKHPSIRENYGPSMNKCTGRGCRGTRESGGNRPVYDRSKNNKIVSGHKNHIHVSAR